LTPNTCVSPVISNQVIMSIIIFSLLSIVTPEGGRTQHDELQNGIFSTIAFIVGALTSTVSGYLGMVIATYANARTTIEARKGIAPAFAVGERIVRRVNCSVRECVCVCVCVCV